MILLDTNVLVALADRSDREHARCRNWFRAVAGRLVLPVTVLAEACYLIDRELGPAAEAAFLDTVGVGVDYDFQLMGLLDEDIRRMAELVRRYADRRLGGTDASLVALAERLNITTIATVNRRDFDNVRPRHVHALTIVPD